MKTDRINFFLILIILPLIYFFGYFFPDLYLYKVDTTFNDSIIYILIVTGISIYFMYKRVERKKQVNRVFIGLLKFSFYFYIVFFLINDVSRSKVMPPAMQMGFPCYVYLLIFFHYTKNLNQNLSLKQKILLIFGSVINFIAISGLMTCMTIYFIRYFSCYNIAGKGVVEVVWVFFELFCTSGFDVRKLFLFIIPCFVGTLYTINILLHYLYDYSDSATYEWVVTAVA